MEAQRICLSLVHSAHVDQVREDLRAEKESALCSLKEELVQNHLQEMNDLQNMHQLELQSLKTQQAGNSIKVLGRKLSALKKKAEGFAAVQETACMEHSEMVLCPLQAV